jgi:hypothetical protein
MKTRQRIGTRSTEEYERSASEELTQCVYNKVETVIINCKFLLTIYPINPLITGVYKATRHNIINVVESRFEP